MTLQVDRAAGTFAMSWSHKNGAEWRVDDCIVFREWDRLKQRDVVESHQQYWMESKQRFRSALAKVSIPCTIDSEEFKSSKVRLEFLFLHLTFDFTNTTGGKMLGTV